tara:strand:- start:1671 stop:1937 length:267 start_codon:yes stop_codon:yes gene_type:complete
VKIKIIILPLQKFNKNNTNKNKQIMRNFKASSVALINAIIVVGNQYATGDITKQEFENAVTRIYKDNKCQTGDEIQEIVNNSFKAFLD